jgi:hypothetical protein
VNAIEVPDFGQQVVRVSRERQILAAARGMIFGTEVQRGLNLATPDGRRAAEAVLAGAVSSLAAIDSPILGGAR